MNHKDEFSDTGRWQKRANWVLMGFVAIAAYFLITEHRAHLAGLAYYLPFLFLLACPLLHIFMHGGHGGHGGNGDERSQGTPPGRQEQGSERKQAAAPPPRQHRH